MEIIRKVPVKQRLTVSSRTQLKSRFDHQWHQLDKECRQLSFEQRKLEKKTKVSNQEIEKRFLKEVSRRKDQMRWINQQLEQLEILPNGSELEIEQVETLVSIQEGDHWTDVLQDKEIVIEDGKVIRAR